MAKQGKAGGGLCAQDMGNCTACGGTFCAAPPLPADAPAPAPAPPPVKGSCCFYSTAAKGADPCASCASKQSDGFCATDEDHCEQCSGGMGHFCPDPAPTGAYAGGADAGTAKNSDTTKKGSGDSATPAAPATADEAAPMGAPTAADVNVH